MIRQLRASRLNPDQIFKIIKRPFEIGNITEVKRVIAKAKLEGRLSQKEMETCMFNVALIQKVLVTAAEKLLEFDRLREQQLPDRLKPYYHLLPITINRFYWENKYANFPQR